MSKDEFSSLIFRILSRTPTRSLVHALLNGYGRLHDAELPGPFLVAAAGPFGHRAATVRQALLRMVATEELETTKVGRMTRYRLSAFSRANAAAAAEKLFSPPSGDWDGGWTIVSYHFATSERMEREKVRVTLEMLGFASQTRGLYLHPRDRRKQLALAIEATGLSDRVTVFRGVRSAGPTDTEMVSELFDLPGLADGYRRFIQRFRPLRSRNPKPPEAFAASLAVLIVFLDLAWADPDLPSELLPTRWPGESARKLAVEIVERLEPRAREHGDALLESTGGKR